MSQNYLKENIYKYDEGRSKTGEQIIYDFTSKDVDIKQFFSLSQTPFFFHSTKKSLLCQAYCKKWGKPMDIFFSPC